MRLPCRWDPDGSSVISPPINPTLVQLLGIGLRNSREQIEQAGLLGVVTKAQSQADELIRRATKALAPLEIPESEIRRVVEERARSLPPP